jgi:hypothetical protein
MVDRIFLPFVRLGTGSIPSSGMGLSIVKTTLKQYQGTVSVDSTSGMGSTFYIHLAVISWNLSLSQVPLRAIVTESGNGLASDRSLMLVGKEETSE